jgi:HEAT repeat protein
MNNRLNRLMWMICCWAIGCSTSLGFQTVSLEDFPRLRPDFDSLDPGKRAESQNRWEEFCFSASHPSQESNRFKACVLMGDTLRANPSRGETLFLLRQLERIGREESVPVLQSLAQSSDSIVEDAALRALEGNPTASARRALTDFLVSSDDSLTRTRMIDRLGSRADIESAPFLISQLSHKSPQVQTAAARALSKLDSLPAAKAIFTAWQNAQPSQAGALTPTVIAVATRTAKSGRKDEAEAMFRALYESRTASSSSHAAALGGLLNLSVHDKMDLMVTALRGSSRLDQQVALGYVPQLSDEDVGSLVQSFPQIPEPIQAPLLSALGAHRKKSALTVVERACQSGDDKMKLAGISALGGVGSKDHLELLLEQLRGSDPLKSAAVKSLSTMADPEIDRLLIHRLNRLSSDEERMLCMTALSNRRSPALADFVADPKLLSSPNPSIRKQSVGILSRLGTQSQLTALLKTLPTVPDEERENTSKAIVTICQRIPDRDAQSAPIIALFQEADENLRPYLLSIAGRIGGKDAEDFVSGMITNASKSEKDAAITALCNWPDSSVGTRLLAIAQFGETENQRIRAIRALARVVVLPSSHYSPDEQLSIMKRLMAWSNSQEERKLVLDRVKSVTNPGTVEFLRSFLEDSELKQQAESSLVHLARVRELRRMVPSLRDDLVRIAKGSSNPDLRKRSQQFLQDY